MSKSKCNHAICKKLHEKLNYNGAGVIIGTIKDGKVNVLLGFEKIQYNKKDYDLWIANQTNKNKKYNSIKNGAFVFFSGSYEESKSRYDPECYIETSQRELAEEAKLTFKLDTFTQIINNGTPQLNDKSGGAVFLAPIEYKTTENLNNLVKTAFNDTNLPSDLKEMEYLQYFCIEGTNDIETNKNQMYPWAYNIINDNKQTIIDIVKNKLKQDDATNADPEGKTTTLEGTILYVDPNSNNPNMKVSTIKLNEKFEEWIVKEGKWTRFKKGGSKSKSTKKAMRSK